MNNRQAGRRRGRGGQRSQGNPQGGNRIDNRARGNANQLYEKYKNLARDAQMQGDRVHTEYYLQFADHYFRVLNENRSRAEEHQRRQREDADDSDDNEDEGEEQRADEQRSDRRRDRDRDSDRDGGERPGRRSRRRGGDNDDDQPEGAEAKSESDEAGEAPAPRRRGRPRREAANESNGEAAIEADRLPPALGAEEGEEKPRRRRGRPPAGDAIAAE
jgi:hypothetical protein